MQLVNTVESELLWRRVLEHAAVGAGLALLAGGLALWKRAKELRDGHNSHED